MTMTPIEDKELREFIDKQFEEVGLDMETKEVFVDTFMDFQEYQKKAYKNVLESWPDRDNLPTKDPIGDTEESKSVKLKDYDPFDESYYTVIRQAGAHIDHKDCVQPFKDSDCCKNYENHKEVPVFTSMITICTVCNEKIG